VNFDPQVLSMDKLELVAQALHEGWRSYHVATGRRYGPVRSATTHPHLVAWSSLDTESQNQDRFIAALLLRDWAEGRLAPGQLPAAIHDAWTCWEHLQGNVHPHAGPFAEVHAEGEDEHAVQAALVEVLLTDEIRAARASRLGSR
jgi:cation transport regulator ChaB